MNASTRKGRKGNGKKKNGEFAPIRNDLYGSRHLPGYMYTSREIFEEEVDKLFMKEWLCVGRVEQFPNPGDYMATRIVGEPVVVCRNDKGELNAFANVCRHRGTEVAPKGTGNVKEFSCPYHGWLYDLNGSLVGAPYTKEIRETFDIKNCRLKPVKLDVWQGYIFINFDPDSAGLEHFLDDEGLRVCAEECRPGETMIADEFTQDIACNWKFIPENLLDIYHVNIIHADSFGKDFKMNDFKFKFGPRGQFHATYEIQTMAPDGVPLFDRMPWLEDKPKNWAYTAHVGDLMTFFARPDVFHTWVCYPLDVDLTRLTVWIKFPKASFDLPAFWERVKVYSDFHRIVASEDSDMMCSLQNGVGTRSFEPGPMVRLEEAIHHNVNHYLDRMYGEGATSR